MTYIFRNKESGEIFQDLIFKNDEIQIINPTNEVLEKYGWEILDDYPVIEELDDYVTLESETLQYPVVESEIEEEQMSEIEIKSEV